MIKVTPLRHLNLNRPLAPGRPSFLSAASGLVRLGDSLFVVADDSLALGRFSTDSEKPGELHQLLHRKPLPLDEKQRKAVKPDLESLTLVESPKGHVLLTLGSGSTDERCTGVCLPLDEDGAPGDPREFDLRPLYQSLRDRFPQLNVEGLAVSGTYLRLAHRGNGAGGKNALIDLNLKRALAACQEGRSWSGTLVERVVPVELGGVEGGRGRVPWTLTDLSPLPGGLCLFTAAAEDTTNPYDDGEVLGSAVGIVNQNGSVMSFESIELPIKLEGASAAKTPNGLDIIAVTDGDDPAAPAMMYHISSDALGD